VARAALATAPASEAGAQALVRGLDWLTAQQQTNGCWSNPSFPALSALPLWALSVAKRPTDAEAIRRATDFLVSCVRPDGGIYVDVPGVKGGGLGTYNTAICMTALHYTGRRDLDDIVRKARAYIAGSQHFWADEYRGGFGYDRATGRPYTDLMNTHWALSAMRVTQGVEDGRPAGEKRVDVDWQAALAYVEKLQLAPGQADAEHAGGFIYNPNDPKAGVATNAAGKVFLRSYGSITYAGLLSLIYAQVGRDDPRVVSAVDFARRHWTLAENPGMGQQGLFYYYTIMARALATTGLAELPAVSGQGGIAWRDELVAALVAAQKPDGSWINRDNRFWEGDPVLATAYALLALKHALGMLNL
jgi:squalene-hopene/tetraprenyl-beta-curcumene cyclase